MDFHGIIDDDISGNSDVQIGIGAGTVADMGGVAGTEDDQISVTAYGGRDVDLSSLSRVGED